MDNIDDLTVLELKKWQDEWEQCKTASDWKAHGRKFRDKYGLTDRQALDYMRGDLP